MTPTCIMVAPNGARRTKSDHPRLPTTPAELAYAARSCHAAGAAAIHLHVRDTAGRHSLCADAYRAAIAAVRSACPEIVIQITTEAAGVFDLDAQIGVVEALRPGCVSFSIAELMRHGVERGERYLAWAAEQGISNQFILYDAEQIAAFAGYWRAGKLHLDDAPRIILVAGRYSVSQDSDPEEFEALYAALCAQGLDREAVWMTCAFGRGEMACLARTIQRGGHVRVGFENAIVDSQGRPALDNAQRVALVAGLIRRYGHRPATEAEAAAILGRQVPDALVFRSACGSP